MFENPSLEERCALLRRTRTVAVVGLSPNPSRPSHAIARDLKRFGFRVIPVRPKLAEALGEKAYGSLTEVPETIDLVNVFRSAEHLDGIVEECLALRLPALWIQSGIVNEAAALRARQGGMMVVMDRCIARDYSKFCGNPAAKCG